MTQICDRCDSQNIIPDYERGKQVGWKCLMCGHDKFKEEEMSKTMCMAEGCSKYAVMYNNGEHYCSVHGKEAFGITKKELDESKRGQRYSKPRQKSVVDAIHDHSLVLDFKEYPELHKAIAENARNEMRTPEMQVLWILKSIVERAA